VHLVVRADDGYRVEIQLRTVMQDAWANMSESIATEHDIEVKYGNGPDAVRIELERSSDAMHRSDQFEADSEAGGFLEGLPSLLEAFGAAAALQRVVDETWPEAENDG